MQRKKMKNSVLIIFSLGLAAALINCSSGYGLFGSNHNKSHTLILGSRQYGLDRLMYQEGIVKPSKWLQVVEVTKIFNVSHPYVITEVRAIDQKANGNGAYVKNYGGGPGHDSVKLNFKSLRGHGIHFLVQVYAKPRYHY